MVFVRHKKVIAGQSQSKLWIQRKFLLKQVLPALMGYPKCATLHQFDLHFQLEQSLNQGQHFSKLYPNHILWHWSATSAGKEVSFTKTYITDLICQMRSIYWHNIMFIPQSEWMLQTLCLTTDQLETLIMHWHIYWHLTVFFSTYFLVFFSFSFFLGKKNVQPQTIY